MGRFQNFDEVYTALYVDFDTTYLRLFEQDPTLARVFATHPQRWLRWLESHAIRMMYGENVRRRIVKKHCYLNPQRHAEFKPYLIRSGFQITECTAFSNNGKTNASVLMTMDCLDALKLDTRYDEFIILSNDADLTPLLLRIQEHARRTLMLSVGYTNPLFASSCSWRIREDWFLTQALEDSRLEGDEGSLDRNSDARESHYAENRYEHKGGEITLDTPENGKVKAYAFSLPASRRIRLSEVLKQIVAESNVPVPLPSIAQVLQHEQEVTSDWFGAGTLKELLTALEITPLELSHSGHGFVFDPTRHESPEAVSARSDFKQQQPELYEFALEINQLTDIPLLKPSHYSRFFHTLIDEAKSQILSRAQLVSIMEEHCDEEGFPLGAEEIAFILDAIISGGCPLTARPANINPDMAGSAFFKKALELCEHSSHKLSIDKKAMLASWLMP